MLAKVDKYFFSQQSRVTWLALGDNNMAYFHHMVDTRNSYNLIHYLIDINGTKIESHQGIHNHCISYFSNLFGEHIEPPLFVQSDLDLLLPFSCSATQQRSLTKPFSREDIKAAFFSLPRNKTSGPDGYSTGFL